MILITGSKSTRAPSAAERTAIIAALRGYLGPNAESACWRFAPSISKVEGDWADGGMRFQPPYRNCALFNGTQLLRRSGVRWETVTAFSSNPSCGAAPPGVMLSLYGACDYEVPSSARPTRAEAVALREVLSRSPAVRRVAKRQAELFLFSIVDSARSFAVIELSPRRASAKGLILALRRVDDRWRIVALTTRDTLNWCRVAPPKVRRLLSLRC